MEDSNINIQLIRQQFLSGVALDKIEFTGRINNDQQIEILNLTVLDNLVKKYPLKYVYQQKFLRKFLQQLENHAHEISDELYEAYCNFLSIQDTNTTHYRHFPIENLPTKVNRLIIQESKSIISEGTTGLCSWQAAESLAEWCLVNKDKINGKSLIELGCGIGLTGLTIISTCSPKKYTFTDCHSSVLKMLKDNIKLNFTTLTDDNSFHGTEIQVIDLSWESIVNYTKENSIFPDVVLAADVVYDSSNFYSLINAIKSLLFSENSCAIIAITVRNDATVSTFIKQLEEHGLTFKMDTLPTYSIFPQSIDTPVMILKVFNNNSQNL